MDALATTINRSHLRKVLEYLPPEVNDIYDDTMKRVDEQIESDRKLAYQILCWIIHAYRQLSLAELRHALAVSPGMTEMDPDALVDETILTSVCAGLVVIDKETHVVRLVRESSGHWCRPWFNISFQIILHRNILNAYKNLNFRVLRLTSRQRVSRTFRLTCLKATIMRVFMNCTHSCNQMLSLITLLRSSTRHEAVDEGAAGARRHRYQLE